MTSGQKQTFWQQHMEGWQQSQLSQKAYCNQHDISFASFGYWRTRLKRKTNSEKKLIPVALSRITSTANIFLPTGVRIEVPVQSLADVLPVICRAEQVLS